MKEFALNLLFLISALLLPMAQSSAYSHRTKRFLTFVHRHTQVVQFNIGVGLPVDLEVESVTMGVGLKSIFIIPGNASDYWNTIAYPLDVITHSINGRSIPNNEESPSSGYDDERQEKFEKHSANVEIIDSGRVASSIENEEQINSLAGMFEAYGLVGKSCVLKAICETAQTPFDYSNGILGELFHVVMSPSSTNDEIIYHEDNEYLHAEKLGKDGAPCKNIFNECKVSLLDQFTGTYSP